jgi:uncharacterized Fe-S cluster-containing radical SAM superfamily protein
MNYCDPAKTAEILRPKMMKGGKYLISRISGAGQAPGEEKILEDYFRYKDYIDNKEWAEGGQQKRWDPKFLGLSENRDGDIQNIKKLEFQNPAYSAARSMGGDPKDYNKVFTVQIAGCDLDCNYCFVPKQLNCADKRFGRYFSAEEIVRHFLTARAASVEPMNVLRISGGNPTILPEIILDVYQAMKKNDVRAYLWIDSNLSTLEYLDWMGKDFKEMLRQKNVGVVGCFKGTNERDFSLICGAGPEYYERQFKVLNWFLEQGTDIYVYLPALVYSDVESNLSGFAKKLFNMNKNLPLRTELLAIIDYPGAKINFERAAKLGRPMPETSQREVFETWHNKVLPQLYSPDELQKYCCQAPLYQSFKWIG